MKKLGIGLIYLLLFLIFLVSFFPKKYLYYKLEHEIKKQDIIISGEEVHEGIISLKLLDGTIYAKSIEAGEFKKVVLYPTLLFNILTIEELNSKISLLPKADIQKLYIFYTPFYPIKVVIRGKSSFGDIKGEIDLKTHKGYIDIYSSKPISFMKKVQEGQYRYEFNY